MLRNWPLLLSLILLQFSFTFPVKATTLWPKQVPSRIVSLSPHITETLFALGAGSKVIAVTRYCDYPNEAIALPNIGGLVDVNIEAIVTLNADLVILLSSQQAVQQQLKSLGIRTLTVSSRTLADIKSTIRHVGIATGYQQEATQLLTHMTAQITAIRLAVKPLAKPTVMISVSHPLGDNALHSVYIAGQQDFYNDLLQIAGGENVYQRPYPKVPHISLEGILNLNPDVIIDVFYDTILPLNGLMVCLFVSFRWKHYQLTQELALGNNSYSGSWLDKYIRFSLSSFIPAILLLIFCNTVAQKFFAHSLLGF